MFGRKMPRPKRRYAFALPVSTSIHTDRPNGVSSYEYEVLDTPKSIQSPTMSRTSPIATWDVDKEGVVGDSLTSTAASLSKTLRTLRKEES